MWFLPSDELLCSSDISTVRCVDPFDRSRVLLNVWDVMYGIGCRCVSVKSSAANGDKEISTALCGELPLERDLVAVKSFAGVEGRVQSQISHT